MTAPSSTTDSPGTMGAITDAGIHDAATTRPTAAPNPMAICVNIGRSLARREKRPGDGAASLGASLSSVVLTSAMFVAIFVVAVISGDRWPGHLQVATVGTLNGRVAQRRTADGILLAEALEDGKPNKAMAWLQSVGLARREIPKPVVGQGAYSRWWERLRAGAVLSALVFGLGVALAIAVGLTILGMGLLLERAIS